MWCNSKFKGTTTNKQKSKHIRLADRDILEMLWTARSICELLYNSIMGHTVHIGAATESYMDRTVQIGAV